MKREPFVMLPKKLFEYKLPPIPFVVYCYLLCCHNKQNGCYPAGGPSPKPAESPAARWDGLSNIWSKGGWFGCSTILEMAANETTLMNCSLWISPGFVVTLSPLSRRDRIKREE